MKKLLKEAKQKKSKNNYQKKIRKGNIETNYGNENNDKENLFSKKLENINIENKWY